MVFLECELCFFYHIFIVNSIIHKNMKEKIYMNFKKQKILDFTLILFSFKSMIYILDD